jgi:hypothetical protein
MDQEPLPGLPQRYQRTQKAQERHLDPLHASPPTTVQALPEKRRRWTRREVAARRAARRSGPHVSEREYARAGGVARSTFRHWEKRDSYRSPDDVVAAFFASTAGEAVLRRIFVAAVLVMTFVAPAGYRTLGLFLRLAGLEPFIATSYGAMRRAAQKIERDIVTYGDEERSRLASSMTEKEMSLVLDETFHPQVCLVALEPTSGFIVTEEYSERRDAVHWASALATGLKDLKVKVVQATSDEAKGILAVVEMSLGHHSPDLFHVQHEISKATAAPLAAAARAAERALADARQHVADVDDERKRYEDATPQERGPGRPPKFNERLERGRAAVERAQFAHEKLAVHHRDEMRAIVKGIGADYHPFSLANGEARAPSSVEVDLLSGFERAREIVRHAGLPERCRKAVEKAARVVDAMVATIGFVHAQIAKQLETLHLPGCEAATRALRDLVEKHLIPAIYLTRVASKAPTAEARMQLRAIAASLRERAERQSIWAELDDVTRAHVAALAERCADLFQRSSSCVEGRNGRLDLYHHAFHALPANRLKALTVVHNYFIVRADDTTAAERFFGRPPKDFFERLVSRCDGPPLPAAKRRKKNI